MMDFSFFLFFFFHFSFHYALWKRKIIIIMALGISSNKTAKLEKTIACEIVNNEVNIENDVSKKLNTIIESHISTVQKQKRVVAKCHQDNETAKQKHQV
jgi:hypothetical protein